MRLFLVGATGNTGTQLIDLGLQRGHEVTAFVRSPDKITQRHPRLKVVQGDPLNAEELAAAMTGHDAVLSSLGMRPPKAFRPHTLVQSGAASTVSAMTRAGVSRLVLVSAAVLYPLKGFQYAIFRFILKHIARDLGAAEEIVRATPLKWTIARPPRLVRNAHEEYKAASDGLPDGRMVMSFRGVAAFMLDSVEKSDHLREVVGLAG
jgi:putative NADH-flavin reductase